MRRATPSEPTPPAFAGCRPSCLRAGSRSRRAPLGRTSDDASSVPEGNGALNSLDPAGQARDSRDMARLARMVVPGAPHDLPSPRLRTAGRTQHASAVSSAKRAIGGEDVFFGDADRQKYLMLLLEHGRLMTNHVHLILVPERAGSPGRSGSRMGRSGCTTRRKRTSPSSASRPGRADHGAPWSSSEGWKPCWDGLCRRRCVAESQRHRKAIELNAPSPFSIELSAPSPFSN